MLQKQAAFEKWTPGLFNEEFRRCEIIALRSKKFFYCDEKTDTVKFSLKDSSRKILRSPWKSIEDFCLMRNKFVLQIAVLALMTRKFASMNQRKWDFNVFIQIVKPKKIVFTPLS